MLDLIGIQTGATVADVGGGSSKLTWRLAERVGSAGKVFAVDTQPVMLDRIRKTVAAHGFSNVKISRGGEQDPRLPAGRALITRSRTHRRCCAKFVSRSKRTANW